MFKLFRRGKWGRQQLRWLRLGLLACLSISFCLVMTPWLQAPVTASVVAQQSTSAQEWMQQGRDRYGAGQYAAALESWQQAVQQFTAQSDRVNTASALSNQALAQVKLGQYAAAQEAIAAARDALSDVLDADYNRRILAQVLSAEGQLFMAQGNAVSALASLDLALEQYTALADTAGILRTQLNRAQILRVQGRTPEMRRSLDAIAAEIDKLPDDSPLKAAGYRQLGIALKQSGEISQAEATLQQSLKLAEQRGAPSDISAALLSLGNLSEPTTALAYYQQAADTAPNALAKLQAQVNALNVLVEVQNLTAARSLADQILEELPTLSPSRATLFVHLNLASQALKPAAFEANPPLLNQDAIATLLTTTLKQAKTLADAQAQTYVLGYLGRLQELTQQWAAAVQFTQQAILVAQSINDDMAQYQWQWQLGRIYEAQDQTEPAITAFQQALATLERLRSDLAGADQETRFSFRQEIEPVYRDLVSLLLKTDPKNTPQDNLLQARNVIESLQVEELVNFFRADCVATTPVEIDQVDTNALVVYPIILPERLEIVVSVPGQPLQRAAVPVVATQLNETLDALRQAIAIPQSANRARTARANVALQRSTGQSEYLPFAQQVYDWLIRPIEEQIEAADVDVLVFVLDGAFRNVPMSVLHDGEQYLIEKHAIALTPGLQLLEPQPLAARSVQALVAGLSEARDDFSPLPFVETEVTAIQAQVPGAVLLNESFSKENFSAQLTDSSFPVVHLATHGQFSSDPEQTFILAWDDRIQATELGLLLQRGEISRENAVELLVLSACETAAGDDRAALGLAGVAVRSGARSTLASLWLVDDEGTSVLMQNLYRQLADASQTKAEILRQAQLQLLQDETYEHPYFWAPFVLIGNWL